MGLDRISINSSEKLKEVKKTSENCNAEKTEKPKEQEQREVVKLYPTKSVYEYEQYNLYGNDKPSSKSLYIIGKETVFLNKENPLNIVNTESAGKVGEAAKRILSESKYKIATAGYSDPPEGYEHITKEFLKCLESELGDENTAYITSPTATAGSIDAITTEVEGLDDGTLVYVTSKDFIKYIDLSSLPKSIDCEDYADTPKFVLPDKSDYSEATAKASNIFIATGGRSATVNDFVNAVKHGNKAVIIDNTEVKLPAWSNDKNKIDNASKYIFEQIQAVKDGNSLPYPETGEFTRKFIEENMEKMDSLVRFYKVNNESESVTTAAKQVAEFLNE